MIIIKDAKAQEAMIVAGRLLAQLFDELNEHVNPGISTHELDVIIAQKLCEKKLRSESKGYHGYRHVSCISLNEEVVHGVPSVTRRLKGGDVVKIDVCASWNGYCADIARCFLMPGVADHVRQFVNVAYDALKNGIEKAVVGGYLGDISSAIQETVERNGFSVVRCFAGHGIGKRMHEEPEILNYGKIGQGPRLRSGMTFALEPMISYGQHEVYVMADGWTARTVDGSMAAHVEDTIIIHENGSHIITRLS